MVLLKKLALSILASLSFAGAASAINIVVDYTYDTNSFFDTAAKKAAMQAVADRFSAVITSGLSEAALVDDSSDQRIGFTHPGTGASWQVSSAASSASDALSGTSVANEYRGDWTIPTNTWLLYAGGRGLGSAGVGGTGTGLNFTSTFSSPTSVLNRNFRSSGSVSNLPVWGGSIAFDTGTTWHFDIGTSAPSGTSDFYSIALHEVGHALGLATSWDEWSNAAGIYNGSNALAAYNADNGTALTGLSLVSAGNGHWEDGTYDSKIFSGGSPNLAGTVGLGVDQDLLMEPTANYVFPSLRRFELTNTDVGALQDIGWTVIPEPSAFSLLAGVIAFAATRRRRPI